MSFDMIMVDFPLRNQGVGRYLFYRLFAENPGVKTVDATLDWDNLESYSKNKNVMETHYGKMMKELGFKTEVLFPGSARDPRPVVRSVLENEESK